MKPALLIVVAVTVFACNQNTNKNESTGTDSVMHDTVIARDTVNIGSDKQQPKIESSANKLIVPGKSIGKVELGMGDDKLEPEFGKSDMSDAAMGKAWLTWYGKKPDEHNNKTELNIYTTYKDTSMR